MSQPAISWAKEARQDYLAGRLLLTGRFAPADLVDHFRIGMPEASEDIRRFHASNPGAVAYDLPAKAYLATAAWRFPPSLALAL
jgi:hypothetical protein